MKTLTLALAAALLLASCAAGPEPQTVRSEPGCRDVDPPTGSRLVRRIDCRRAAADRDAAQRDVGEMQDLQRQTMPSGMGRR